MRRLLVALLATLAVAPAAAQEAPAAPAPAAEAQAAPATPIDPALAEAVRREMERVKQDLRDEVRAEMQAQQSAREFLETAEGEERKLEFFQVDGYLRFRSDLLNSLDLSRSADPSGHFLYPRPLGNTDETGTITNVNMRLRLEPTLNVSEQIRVLTQVDVLDNVVLGSTPQLAAGDTALLGARTQIPPAAGLNSSVDSVRVKRAWGEVETPVGLLSFGRMASAWGLGILDHAGDGIDQDFGDSADRIQFAIPLRSTPIGPLTVIPYYELVSTGLTSADLDDDRDLGQPFDLDQSDDATALGFKVVRVDTETERDEKLEKGQSSWNYGLYYSYRSQGYEFLPAADATDATDVVSVRREASAHVLDAWGRWERKSLKLEWEAVGVLGEIGNATLDPATTATTGRVLVRQFGAVVRGEKSIRDGRWTFGGELGLASGDKSPGFGNDPGRGVPQAGDVDGLQWGDLALRNFRFNPAYRVDLILWREILGQVTDAWYVKPTLRYTFIDGLSATAAIVYSQAVYAESTPSKNHAPLGMELDLGVSYESDDGFVSWVDYGVLQPLDGFNGAGDTSRAHAIRAGLGIRF